MMSKKKTYGTEIIGIALNKKWKSRWKNITSLVNLPLYTCLNHNKEKTNQFDEIKIGHAYKIRAVYIINLI
jgi:hypothetical protein